MTLLSERPPATAVPRAARSPRRRRRGRLALAVLILVGVVALLGPLFAPHAVTDAVDIPYAPGSAEAPLGTDRLGSDVVSRVLSGGRSLLLTSLAVTGAVCVLGALLGMLAAWRRGWTDTLVLRLADVLLGLPAFLLLSVVVVATGRGTAGVALASGLVLLPESVRVVRAATLRILAQDYVEVAVARGERTVSVLGREVLPNLLPVLAADAGVRFLGAVTVVATAAFLGYGAQPPAADWGLMVLENRDGLTLQPLAVLVPAALLLVLLLSVNLLLDAAFPGPQQPAARPRPEPVTTVDSEAPGTPGSLLSVRGLSVESDDGHRVLEDVDLDLAPGELLAVVGESGSGKTTLALAALGHTGPGLRPTGGDVRLDGHRLLRLDERRLRRVRAAMCGYVAQDPRTALAPHLRVDAQIGEVLRARGVPKERWAERAERALLLAGLDRPHEVVHRRPHQLSGGQRQRVALAVALSVEPRLLVLDEPTSALDTVTSAAFLADLTRMRRETGAAVLLVSHDLGQVAGVADRVAVMDGGRIVELGPAEAVLAEPASERGRALVAAARPVVPASAADHEERTGDDALLRASELSLVRGERVLDGVSFALDPGDCLSVVGPSGCGKTTLLRCLAGLDAPTNGGIRLHGEALARHVRDRDPGQRRRVQLVPQDPYASLNPRHTVAAIVGRPLAFRPDIPAERQPAEVERLLAQVGLDPELGGRLPGALSGGQRQRVALARALAADPEVLLCDEVTSALDPSVATAVTELIARLRTELGLAVVMVTHDLSVAARLGGRVAVLHDGRIRETGPASRVLSRPEHDITRALVAALPHPARAAGEDGTR
ncbi:ATPase component of various ABC-type transport systems with duplicated ATPase domain protein [Streptomyces lincolnensis]|uniref:ATPase component of various ABC-type transport systems with duplicated ATPase domain protein n=1 Tax=Streptomyces lincolnensis TaxID=1915 RepID=A0A1B1M543_STRLN|nr:nickel ABC transporter ATP-binding protein NikE [Streptomyces lincolnensis]ANS63567.1 ATPase component of various ABC-type transport systems with duplicated ATPase domain protein [Streptomyces lincolnensis]AXG52489.1 ATPase component of various ABC-type transport systems with duplicated ATPase domain protein [Streptomyces lincolnensis]QMV05444.1 nickel ABC transporter ATP-binding protein NikE [Streptomyces lincolnensis]